MLVSLLLDSLHNREAAAWSPMSGIVVWSLEFSSLDQYLNVRLVPSGSSYIKVIPICLSQASVLDLKDPYFWRSEVDGAKRSFRCSSFNTLCSTRINVSKYFSFCFPAFHWAVQPCSRNSKWPVRLCGLIRANVPTQLWNARVLSSNVRLEHSQPIISWLPV